MGAVPLWGEWGPHLTQSSGPMSTSLPMPYGSIQAFGHNRHGPKIVGAAAELSPHLTMWPGPRPNSVLSGILIHAAVWPQQTWAEKWGAVPLLFFGEGAGSPSNTMSTGPRPISIPRGILIHPAIWLQQTCADNWGCALGGAESTSNTMLPGLKRLRAKFHLDPSYRLATATLC